MADALIGDITVLWQRRDGVTRFTFEAVDTGQR
jgi:hypothetical protein